MRRAPESLESSPVVVLADGLCLSSIEEAMGHLIFR